jgi:3-oxoacyl-[acyl-carrier protein] reductase
MGRLDGKCALITGGGRGIGAATAERFAREGARVGIMGKGEESLARRKGDLAAQGFEVETFLGNVASREDAARTVEAFIARFGRIDVLVNNAGTAMNRKFLEKTPEDWDFTLRVNLVGPFLMAQAAAPHMLAQQSGRIVNVTSVRGVEQCGREGVMDYSAAKAGLVSLTKTLAKELAPHVTVNAVAPGHTETDLLRSLPDEVKATMLAGTYLKRFGQPADIAAAILFLASDDASFITGQHLVVDGGFSLKQG